MDGESLRYDAALAAGLLIYERFVPEPDKPDALILGQIVFIIIEAMEELERRQESAAMPQNRMHMDDGGAPERWPEELWFFCATCLRQFKVKAAHEDKRCLCPGCGAAMRTPDVTARN
jgi:hypothetical protein